jgi:GWxTD domain-containing protein
MIRAAQFIFIGCALGLALTSCSSTMRTGKPYAGLERSFEPGSPSFDAQVHPSIENGRRGLRVDVAAPELVLVYRKSGPELKAEVEWLIRVMDGAGDHVLDEQTKRIIMRRSPGTRATLFRTAALSAFFLVPSGTYTVEIVLEDLSSSKLVRKNIVATIPAQDQPLSVSELLVETTAGRPLIGLQIPDTVSSMRGYFYLTGNVSRSVEMRSRLVRVGADTTAARPPYWNGPPGDDRLSDRLIATDTLSSDARLLRRGPLRRIDVSLPSLGIGVFRLDIELDDTVVEGAPDTKTLSRYIIIRNAAFPRILGYGRMIPPMEYLARADEWEQLRSSAATDGARTRFDAFWGRYMSDKNRASQVIQAFFSRVEVANLRYSDSRQGWKSDRGMVYILLGDPLFIENNLESETWFYSYDEGRVERTFRFNRTFGDEKPRIIQTLILDRSFDYEPFWTRLVERWRKGEIL